MTPMINQVNKSETCANSIGAVRNFHKYSRFKKNVIKYEAQINPATYESAYQRNANSKDKSEILNISGSILGNGIIES
jgi:hypothetical protein